MRQIIILTIMTRGIMGTEMGEEISAIIAET
jgi:hypothetical protein